MGKARQQPQPWLPNQFTDLLLPLQSTKCSNRKRVVAYQGSEVWKLVDTPEVSNSKEFAAARLLMGSHCSVCSHQQGMLCIQLSCRSLGFPPKTTSSKSTVWRRSKSEGLLRILLCVRLCNLLVRQWEFGQNLHKFHRREDALLQFRYFAIDCQTKYSTLRVEHLSQKHFRWWLFALSFLAICECFHQQVACSLLIVW